jgi:predicted nucleotidyltransferase
MSARKDILLRIKNVVREIEPDARIILYGSTARGDRGKDSDIDLLILINRRKITREEEKRIKYPLYDLEFDTGQIISPLVVSALEWEIKHRITPFYQNILREGIEI